MNHWSTRANNKFLVPQHSHLHMSYYSTDANTDPERDGERKREKSKRKK